MMKPLIGLVPLYDEEKESLWMLPGYMNMLESDGAIPIILPLTSDPQILDYFLEMCNGFILTGGHDVNPEFYGKERSAQCGVSCSLRDEMEQYLFQHAVERDQSILGICRGIQFMNACMGGTLYQDIPTEYLTQVEHHMQPPYDRAAHQVHILKHTLLYQIVHTDKLDVNSYHHQAVRTVAKEFKIAAVSEDGIIESIYLPDKNFVLGIQWHPEFSYQKDIYSRMIIHAFIQSANNRISV